MIVRHLPHNARTATPAYQSPPCYNAPISSERDKTKWWQFSVRNLLSFTLAVSIPACFVSYYYRAGAFDDVGMIGAVMIIAGLAVPPAVSWLLLTTGRKTVAAVITFAWVLGLMSAIVGRWL